MSTQPTKNPFCFDHQQVTMENSPSVPPLVQFKLQILPNKAHTQTDVTQYTVVEQSTTLNLLTCSQ